MRKGIVDRLEDGKVIVEWEKGKMGRLPQECFSVPPREGDVFLWEKGQASPLTEETGERKKKMQDLFDRIKGKS